MASNTFWATPTVRIAWWMRPPPRRVWATAKACPSPPSSASVGTRTSSYRIRACDPSPRGSPKSPRLRSIVTPGVSVGTRNMDMPWYALTSGFDTAITMRNDAVLALEEKNFDPLMTHSSPSRSARVVNIVGSAPACGSVIE
jgi:hypothetical protein